MAQLTLQSTEYLVHSSLNFGIVLTWKYKEKNIHSVNSVPSTEQVKDANN